MIFQAYRVKGFSDGMDKVNQIYFVRRFPSLCFPCAPFRSSFASALDDVRKFRKLVFCSSVCIFSSTNQL